VIAIGDAYDNAMCESFLMARTVELMRQNADKKVARLAAQHIQDRAYGRTREEPPDQPRTHRAGVEQLEQ
jgi:hypothetical protein